MTHYSKFTRPDRDLGLVLITKNCCSIPNYFSAYNCHLVIFIFFKLRAIYLYSLKFTSSFKTFLKIILGPNSDKENV